MSTLQLPPVRDRSTRVGVRCFRKQVLPIATVDHPRHGPLHFTRERLRSLAERFAGRVPFVLADAQNFHSSDPERLRGHVTALDLGDEGLFATIEATKRGATLLRDNPKLGVSVRLIRDERGREKLAHVCGTLDPVVKGMSHWEPIEATHPLGDVIDLTAGSYRNLTPDQGGQAMPDRNESNEDARARRRRWADAAEARGEVV